MVECAGTGTGRRGPAPAPWAAPASPSPPAALLLLPSGVYVAHNSVWGASYVAWLTPIAVAGGVLVAADLALRLLRPADERTKLAVYATQPMEPRRSPT